VPLTFTMNAACELELSDRPTLVQVCAGLTAGLGGAMPPTHNGVAARRFNSTMLRCRLRDNNSEAEQVLLTFVKEESVHETSIPSRRVSFF
jgi:hypothetical protein